MKVSRLVRSLLVTSLLRGTDAFVVDVSFSTRVITQRGAIESDQDTSGSSQRRDAFKALGLMISGGVLSTVMPPSAAWASGGATAGKYT